MCAKPSVYLIMMALTALGTTANAQSAPERQVTFTKDVAPILQRSCQTCHRPGSIAPMSLLTTPAQSNRDGGTFGRTAGEWAPHLL